jgi:hypothetical protein
VDLDAAIQSAPGRIVLAADRVRRDRARRAEPNGRHAPGQVREASLEHLRDAAGATLGQRLVDGVAALAVGVALDQERLGEVCV